MAGAGGFEPPHGGIKIHCLTAWRRPIAIRSSIKRARFLNSPPAATQAERAGKLSRPMLDEANYACG